MTSRTRRPNISPIPETPDAKTTSQLYKEHDEQMRNESKKANEAKERVLARKKAEEKRNDAVNTYASRLKSIEEQKVDEATEIDLKLKDLKELEDQIKEEIILQEKRKAEYIDEIYSNGESLVNEIEEKRVKQTKKSIFKKLIDFLFGF